MNEPKYFRIVATEMFDDLRDRGSAGHIKAKECISAYRRWLHERYYNRGVANTGPTCYPLPKSDPEARISRSHLGKERVVLYDLDYRVGTLVLMDVVPFENETGGELGSTGVLTL